MALLNLLMQMLELEDIFVETEVGLLLIFAHLPTEIDGIIGAQEIILILLPAEKED